MIDYKVTVVGQETQWSLYGQLHREDGPAVVRENGTQIWYLNGMMHREGGPAMQTNDGHKAWYIKDHLHRTDGPALEWANGDKIWYSAGKTNRIDGPAVVRADGTEIWYSNGKVHRTDGPAAVWADGIEFWYLNGDLQRAGGPVVKQINGAPDQHPNGEEVSVKPAINHQRRISDKPALVIDPPSSVLRQEAMSIYTPPFKYVKGYIYDANMHVVSDDDGVEGAVAARIRGWGRISYMSNANSLQDELGGVVAQALTNYWQANSVLK
jgi:hypothetical protein